ncbi:tRNA (guanosine(46)-N7)-methyltransferase TrmB [Fluviispira sanaruensis]|uniref:tRNA (guanine-N(7)-)-methyltransferase n=1 Tax=Fluviispira sanaruensis TaxID=2493639 RepID=A0A4P2VQT3_FLUSA|nr:tRNA (guanosine(46)-N7)-methyltransferase TrmB [Fluviispira sanaruensis]BBH54469.1 tRNA (guanosine(46)-N7)-methyltransferase TrmB [Fluviispira sanaruensis]
MRKVGTIIDNLRKGEKAPDRHENPYLKEALGLSDFLLTQNELHEKYASLFTDMTKPIVIEVGCYMGKTVLELVENNKDKNILGLDITYKRVVKAARKLKRNSSENGRIAICDGKSFLSEIVPDNSLLGICIFFPDPWPKDRHEKNRLLKSDFIKLLHAKLVPGGFFWFKTDHEPYFLETQKFVLSSGFTPDDANDSSPLAKPRNIRGDSYETAFQKLFTAKGVPFYQRVFLKH